MANPWDKYAQPQPQQPGKPWEKYGAPVSPAQRSDSTATSPAFIATDVAKSGGTGLVKGLVGLPGIPGDVEYLVRKMGNLTSDKPVSEDTFLPTSREVIDWTGYKGHAPQTFPGRIAETVGEFAPGAAIAGPAGAFAKTGRLVDALTQTGKNVVKYAAVPGVASEGAGQLTAGTAAEPWARLSGAIIGGGVMAAKRPKVSDAPTVDELKTASQALYNSPEVKGLLIEPTSFDNAVNTIVADVKKAGIDKTLHPDSTAALKRITEAQGTAPTLEELDTLRQIAGDAAMSINPREERIAGKIIHGIDNYIDNLKPTDIIAGDPAVAAAKLKEARALWQRKSKGQTVDIIFERAKNAVGANYTQAGMQTALRQQFRWLADPKYPQRMRGFTPDEKAAVLRVVRGGPLENTLRLFGRLAARGPVTGGGAVAVGTLAGPVVGGGFVVGAEAAKRAAQGMSVKNAELVSALVRGGKQTTLPSELRQLPGLSLYYGSRTQPQQGQ